jgi:hypothetical protein
MSDNMNAPVSQEDEAAYESPEVVSAKLRSLQCG